MGSVAEHFISSLRNSERHSKPWRHWLLDDMYPAGMVAELEALPFAPPSGVLHEGKREINNSSRVFLTPDVQEAHASVGKLVRAMLDPRTLSAIEAECGIDLSGSLLRLEYCMDVGDFWLEPHTDIFVKTFTMLLYLSSGAGSDNCGTDVLAVEEPHGLVGEAPFGFNKGTLFIPAHDTWHGFHKRKINGVRKSIIINYVTKDWRARHELASPDPVK
ncbi:MAG: 2OG-Fe(II) oxygenase [Magnetospirillum sp.]|nr:2OG-Fe(II) oxygenase [Magnetospirillum sp.]